MQRRDFIVFLAGLPLVGRLLKAPEAPTCLYKTCGRPRFGKSTLCREHHDAFAADYEEAFGPPSPWRLIREERTTLGFSRLYMRGNEERATAQFRFEGLTFFEPESKWDGQA